MVCLTDVSHFSLCLCVSAFEGLSQFLQSSRGRGLKSAETQAAGLTPRPSSPVVRNPRDCCYVGSYSVTYCHLKCYGAFALTQEQDHDRDSVEFSVFHYEVIRVLGRQGGSFVWKLVSLNAAEDAPVALTCALSWRVWHYKNQRRLKQLSERIAPAFCGRRGGSSWEEFRG